MIMSQHTFPVQEALTIVLVIRDRRVERIEVEAELRSVVVPLAPTKNKEELLNASATLYRVCFNHSLHKLLLQHVFKTHPMCPQVRSMYIQSVYQVEHLHTMPGFEFAAPVHKSLPTHTNDFRSNSRTDRSTRHENDWRSSGISSNR